LIVQTGPVDFEIFMAALGGTCFLGVAAFGWLSRRMDRLDAKLSASDSHNTQRHDNGLADVWQALEAHRTESRQASDRAASISQEFRERTLRELGDIKSTLARLTALLPLMKTEP
jgi:hypothetical protein